MTTAVRTERRTIAEAARSERARAQDAPFLWVTRATDHDRTKGSIACRLSTDSADHFVEWTFTRGTLVVRNDAFGLIPLFVYTRGDEIAVSPSLQKLVCEGAYAELDEAALAVFLRLGFFLGEDTPFRHIRALAPGAMLVWRDGMLELRQGGSYVVPRRTLARDEAIDHAIELTRQAVGRRMPMDDNVAVPLSGGRDSRHLLLELVHRGCRPRFAVTVPRYPPNAGEDQRLAPVVAAAVGIPHAIAIPTDRPAVAEARKNVETNFCTDEHAWFYGMLDYLRGRATTVYEGIGGSLWKVGWLPQRDVREAWAAGRTEQVAERALEKHQQQPITDAVIEDLAPPGVDFSRDLARQRLAQELARHAAAPDPGKSFHFWNRLRRELALVPCVMMRSVAAVHTPLVDRDLTEFLLSLEPEIVSPVLSRSDKRFHSEAIVRGYPRFAHLPFEADAARRSDPSAHYRQFALDVAGHLLADWTDRSHGQPRPCRWLRSSYAFPRLAYMLVNRRYAASMRWLPRAALYLRQLEQATEG
jgi:asparagine synthase (glutamine-hydrolysing)